MSLGLAGYWKMADGCGVMRSCNRGEGPGCTEVEAILRKSSRGLISMSFRTTARLAAFFLFALAAVARAQAPAQGSTQTTAPPGTESNSLLAAGAAGDAQAHFALGNYYFRTR
jgi:hypothetical protein